MVHKNWEPREKIHTLPAPNDRDRCLLLLPACVRIFPLEALFFFLHTALPPTGGLEIFCR